MNTAASRAPPLSEAEAREFSRVLGKVIAASAPPACEKARKLAP